MNVFILDYVVIAENVDLSGRRKAATLEDDSEEKGGLLQPVQDPRDGFGDYHSSSPERSQQRSQQP